MNKSLIIPALAILTIWSCSRELDTKESVEECVAESLSEPESCLIEGELQVEFDDETISTIESEGLEAVMAGMSDLGVYKMERLFPDAGEFEARQRLAGLHRWYKVYYSREEMSGTKAAGEVGLMFPGATVEVPRRIKQLSIPFNDLYKNEQWNLYNDGSISGSVRGVDVNVLPVWEISGGSSDVIVNVVDGGVSLTHPDLSGVVIPGGPNGSKNFVDDSYTITSDFHGTHVGGIIAAKNNNGTGVSSIAGGLNGNGGVKILVSQIFMDNDEGEAESGGDEAQAIVWGANHGALISQNSWAYTYNSEREAKQGYTPKSLKNAIDYFVTYAGCDSNGNQTGLMKGGLVVFAAGNENWAYAHPSDYEPVIAVGAIGPSGRKASYSNYGPWVDICAPGGDYSSFGNNWSATILSTAYDSDYYYAQGTSMACPHVSGVAALMVSLFGGQGFTCDDLKEMLLKGANSNYGVSENIGPMLDAVGAMNSYSKETPPVINSDYTGNYIVRGHEILEVNYTVFSNSPSLKIEVDCGAGAQATVGDRSLSIRFNDRSGNLTGKYTARIKVESQSGLTAEKTIQYQILENHPPVVTVFVGDKLLESKSSIIRLYPEKYFSDVDGGEINYSWSTEKGDILKIASGTGSLSIQALKDGVETVTLIATDPCGKSCSQSFRVGSYDDSQSGPAAYPNPVVDKLNVCAGGNKETAVSLYSSSGVLLATISGKCSIINPLVLDMSSCAPGRYRAVINCNGKEYNRDIIKK